MKLEIRIITNKKNLPEKQVKTPDGWKTITEIARISGIPRQTLASRVRTAKTYEDLINPERKPHTKKDRKFPILKMRDKSGIKCIHVKIGEEWKSVAQIVKETGKPVRTIAYRIKKDIDPYQKEERGRKPQGNTLWEGVPDHIREACESGSNKDLLAI